MAIKIELLRCFSMVAQSGNLAEASSRLGRTQSAVSMSLKQLEEHLGQRLFVGERKNALTPLGEQVFEFAQRQLEHFDYTVKAIETFANSPEGLVRIASVPSVASLIFPTVVGAFIEQNKRVKVDLRDTDTQQVVTALVQGQADIGIASAQQPLNGVRQIPLFSDKFGLICSPDHPLARQRKVPTIEDVITSGFVLNNLCSLIKTEAFQAATAGSRVAVHNTLSLIAMVRDRNWVTVLPQTVAHVMPADLAFREVADLPDYREVCLFIRDRNPFLGLAEELAKMICQFDWTDLIDPEFKHR